MKNIRLTAILSATFFAQAILAAPDSTRDQDKDGAPAKTVPGKRGSSTSRTPAQTGKYGSGSRHGSTTDTDTDSKRPSTHSSTSSDSFGDRHKSSTTTESTSQHETSARSPHSGTVEKKTETTTTEKTTGHGATKEVTTTRETETTVHSKTPLHIKPTDNGGHVKVTPSGQVREKAIVKSDGTHTEHFAPTGRKQTEVIVKSNGAQETKHFAPNGQISKTVVVTKTGAVESTSIHYGRDGHERVSETIHVDARGREVSKTVIVKQTTVIVHNSAFVTVAPFERHYERARFGFVYHPVFTIHSPVFVSWYDPYWYSPVGVVIVHPFHFSWGWDHEVWYHRQHHYWATYEVYPTPAYWVTDWMIAGYAADHYAAAVSADQAREEARLAHEDAEKAKLAAQQAQEQAEIAEAHAAAQAADARAARAEAKLAQIQAAEARVAADKPSATLAPIDTQTKEDFRKQIETTVAEKKAFAEQAANNPNAVAPDVSKALADPKHIYPVASSINVISAADQSPAGTLSEGDLLKVEPGQEAIISGASETTFIKMRVLTSKGEDGEAQAGTVVSVPLKSVQEFDSEFRAKLDQGLAEADKNKDQFKTAGQ